MHHLEPRPVCLTAVCSLFLALSWTAFALRFYVRGILIKAIGADDYTAFVGLLLFSLLNIGAIINAQWGFGLRDTELTLQDLCNIFRIWYLESIAYIVTMAVIKMSICLSLHRIAIERKHFWIIYITATLTIIISIVITAISIFQCSPVSYFWTRFAGAPGHCLSDSVIGAMAWSQSAVNVVTDVTLAFLPFFMIWDLPMDFRTKLSVYLVLALGSIACIATIARLPTFKGLSDTKDFTYDAYYMGILSIIEPGLGLTASCLITLRPLLRKLFNGSSIGRKTPSYCCFIPGCKSRSNGSNQLGGNGNDLELREGCGGTNSLKSSYRTQNSYHDEYARRALENSETRAKSEGADDVLGSRHVS